MLFLSPNEQRLSTGRQLYDTIHQTLVLNSSLRQSCSVFTNVTSALEVSLNDIWNGLSSRHTDFSSLARFKRCINSMDFSDSLEIV